MCAQYITVSWLDPLRRRLTKPQWQNLILLIVAVQLARTFIGRQLALYLITTISSRSCYRRLERVLARQSPVSRRLQRAWVRLVLRMFAPGRGRLNLLIDWTWHRDRCRSLWIMLPVGGRGVPVAFFLAPPSLGGKGSQRQFEDQALKQLREWLPRGRRALLIGDRGFAGLDRMQFLKRLDFQFLLRVQGQTQIEVAGAWIALRDQIPAVGERRAWEGVRIGKGCARQRRCVQVVAVRQQLLAPKAVRNWKGKRTGQTVEDTTWFLVTDLPLGTDAVALYALRMQIEESFRDFKALMGMEQERTKRPWERLPILLWAVTIGMALDLHLGGAAGQRTRAPRISRKHPEAPSPEPPEYRSESATRAGLHDLVVQLVLGQSPFTPDLREIAAKSERMKARPQVRDRRRPTPGRRRRGRSPAKIHSHA